MKIDNSFFEYDNSNIVFIGLPKTISKTPNPLTKKGPDLLRFAINNKDDFDEKKNVNSFDRLKICDLGNSKKFKLKKLENQKLIILGGEHSITYDTVKEITKFKKDLTLIVFDAHLDVRENLEENAKFLRKIIDEKIVKEVILIGQRVYSKEEKEYIDKKNIKIQKKVNLKNKNIYISFDIDTLDSIYVPTCSTPESFGEDLKFYNKQLINLVKNNNLIAIDFVEFSGKNYDITYSNIASLIMNILKEIKIN